ncbi:MAG TPA: EXLDI protein [Ktedonobacteraceae bacterium]|nr:EXLDI protein [Ktedonobacteraceae bacterium]
MPNRTIYVADADLPIFEKAQKLTGDNLSAAIARALRSFVEQEEARQGGYEDVSIKVGKGRPFLQQHFRGRLLARRHIRISNDARILTLSVYQTAKGRFAVYSKNQPNWNGWSQYWAKQSKQQRQSRPGNQDWDWLQNWDWSQNSNWSQNWDWSTYQDDEEYRLDVFESLDQLKENVPEELFDAANRYLNGEDAEFLDI